MRFKMKRIIFIVILIVLIILGVLLITKNNKYYLDDKYYASGKYILEDSSQVNKLIDNKSSFILFTYNSYCSFPIACEDVFKEVMLKYKIDIIKIPFANFRKTKLYKNIKFAPTIILIKDGKVITYLHTDSDADLV